MSQRETMKRKVLHGGRKSIITSEGTSKKTKFFCLYSRRRKGAARQSLSLTGLNRFLFAMLQDGRPHLADTTVLKCVAMAESMICIPGLDITMTRLNQKPKYFTQTKKETKYFCSTKYYWCMAPENLYVVVFLMSL